MTIAGFARIIDSVKGMQESITYDAVMGNALLITELNREQMYAGKNYDGTPIEPEYTPFTCEIKEEKGQPYDRVTLFDTGAFYSALGISYEAKSKVLTFESTDWKEAELLEKYGTRIFGVPKDKEQAVRLAINDLVIERIMEIILSNY